MQEFDSVCFIVCVRETAQLLHCENEQAKQMFFQFPKCVFDSSDFKLPHVTEIFLWRVFIITGTRDKNFAL